MNAVPRLSIGLPVYNGENYLAESLDALLGQSYEDFELIISDNASTDGTADICRRYEKQDSRIRYIRQPRNIGCAPNHNFVVGQARGELFKWASHDDLYARDLLKRCVDALDEYPHVVLAHSWTAMIDSSGTVTEAIEYPLATASLRAPERFRSMLFDRRRRRHRRRHPGEGPAPDVTARQLPPRGPDHHHRDRFARPVLPGPGLAVLPARSPRAGRAGVPDRAYPVREPGPAPGEPAAASDRPSVRRVRLGVRRGDPACAAVARGPARVLPLPGAVGGQPGCSRWRAGRAAARLRTRRRCAAQPDHLGRRARGRPGEEAFVTSRGFTGKRERAGRRRSRVGLFGLLGSGNIGNDASMDAVLRYLRADHPDAIVDAMCGAGGGQGAIRHRRRPAVLVPEV